MNWTWPRKHEMIFWQIECGGFASHVCLHCNKVWYLARWQLEAMPFDMARCEYGPRMTPLEWLFGIQINTWAPGRYFGMNQRKEYENAKRDR